jgi:hypothetical protein
MACASLIQTSTNDQAQQHNGQQHNAKLRACSSKRTCHLEQQYWFELSFYSDAHSGGSCVLAIDWAKNKIKWV